MWGVAFVFSLTLHEASHALVAKLGGDLTAYNAGQVSLNPLPHMRREPLGMVLIPLVTFFLNSGNWMIGWASTPYNPEWAQRFPRRSALMALAGPVSNTILFFISFLALKIGLEMGYFSRDPSADTGLPALLNHFLLIMANLNLILAIFNFLPLPPLDGAEIILIFFAKDQANVIRDTMRSVGLFGILIAWMAFPRIYFPIRDFFFALL